MTLEQAAAAPGGGATIMPLALPSSIRPQSRQGSPLNSSHRGVSLGTFGYGNIYPATPSFPAGARTYVTADSTGRSNVSGLDPYIFGSPANATPSSKGAHFTLIANVPYDTVRQDLVVEFRKYGRVELAMVVCDEASRHPHKEWTSTAGYAFVRFSQRSEAAAAIQAASMGLITIRGTRVRADWARKDSYAKRGRVSPTQGAPLLGPLGVPDGIEQLHQSLLEQQAARLKSQGPGSRGWDFQAGATVATTTTTAARNYDSPVERVDCSPSTSASEGRSNMEVLQALQEAFSQMLASRNPPCDNHDGLQTAPTTPEIQFHDESAFRSEERNEKSSCANSGFIYRDIDDPVTPLRCSPDIYARTDLYSRSQDTLRCQQQQDRAIRLPSQQTATEPPALLACQHGEGVPEVQSPKSTRHNGALKFEEVLSPCSRGLLAQALSDVVGVSFDNTAGGKECGEPGVRKSCFPCLAASTPGPTFFPPSSAWSGTAADGTSSCSSGSTGVTAGACKATDSFQNASGLVTPSCTHSGYSSQSSDGGDDEAEIISHLPDGAPIGRA